MQTCAKTRIKLKYFTSFLRLAARTAGTAETLRKLTVNLITSLVPPALALASLQALAPLVPVRWQLVLVRWQLVLVRLAR